MDSTVQSGIYGTIRNDYAGIVDGRVGEFEDAIGKLLGAALLKIDKGIPRISVGGMLLRGVTSSLFNDMNTELNKALANIYVESYNKNAEFIAGKLFGGNSRISQTMMGKSYIINEQRREYINIRKEYEANVMSELNGLFNSMAKGTISYEAFSAAVEKKLYDTYKYMVSRMREEGRYLANQAVVDSGNASGVLKYIIVATLDDRTSEICLKRHGEIFEAREAEVGETIPPFHVNCRSIVIPFDEKDFIANGGEEDYERWLEDYIGRYYGGDKSSEYDVDKRIEEILEQLREPGITYWDMIELERELARLSGEMEFGDDGDEYKGNYQDFKDAVGLKESSDNYKAVNQYGYMGRYQFGLSALQDIGFKDEKGDWTTKAKEHGVSNDRGFLDNSAVQDVAFDLLVKVQLSYIKYYGMEKYIGTTMNGVLITESGLVAASHLIGIGGLIEAINANDLNSVKDGNGTTAKDYIELFGGYDLSEVK